MGFTSAVVKLLKSGLANRITRPPFFIDQMRHRRACHSKFPIDADWLAGPAAVPLTIGLVGTPGTPRRRAGTSQHGRRLPPLPMLPRAHAAASSALACFDETSDSDDETRPAEMFRVPPPFR